MNSKTLAAKARTLKPSLQVGKSGVSGGFAQELAVHLKKYQLVKIKLLRSCPLTSTEVQTLLASQVKAQVIDSIGQTITFYHSSQQPL